ncbi:MAG: STAS domain-containing protein [Leptospiraceae bacterium]|nr:STAS domain-containing protein [Leptospiraceae bacterium]MCK6381192.1 STAS domain-containing protein [Leptospiraceae bacterium]NUM40452.1 STAS domain-containing protein [Leptospiraceae bacterium]
MEINIRENNSVQIISIAGEVDLYNAKELKDCLDLMIKEEKFQVVIDLAKVPFIDSSGIGTLVTGMYRLKKYHGGLKVINITGSVAKVFKLTGMEQHLEVCKSEEEAVSAFGI